MSRFARLFMLLVGFLMLVPAFPTEGWAQAYPPHYRRRRPPPPPPPPVRPRPRRVYRAPVHHRHVAPTPRPRYGIADSRSSVYIGVGPVANFIAEGDDALSKVIDTGGGLDLFLGFRFTRFAALELGALFTFHGTEEQGIENGVFNAVTGDVKIFFLPGSRRIEPFIQAGAGVYLFSQGWNHNELTGGGFQLGLGTDLRLNSMIAIGARFLWRGVFLDNSEATYWSGGPYESTFMNMFTLGANVQLHF